jgi:MFS family permease
MQGLAPVVWSALADRLGRRPIYIASFSVYIVANIALSITPNFAVLVIFRGLQAAGSASTVSIGNGVMQDIASPTERGAFIGFYQASTYHFMSNFTNLRADYLAAVRNFAVTAGPVLGGVFSNFLGFRSIFVFLLISSAVMLVAIVIFLPETFRSIAGNGSLRLTSIYRPLIYSVTKDPGVEGDDMEPREKITWMTIFQPLALLSRKDLMVNLVFFGLLFAVWQMVTSSTTTLFKERFGLSNVLLGVAYLPNGEHTTPLYPTCRH